jgi:tetratricopeptide (TPR) repeat protein
MTQSARVLRLNSVRRAAAWALLFLALTWPCVARAAGEARPLTRYPVDVQELARLTPQYPQVVDRLQRGEALAIAGDMNGALKLFEEASADYPYSGLVWRRRCEALTVLGRRAEAFKACREALQQESSHLNVRAAVRSLFAGPDPLRASELAEALLLGGMERHRFPGEPWGYADLCDVGERLGDEVMLQYCSGELLRIAPNDPATERALAMLRPPWWVAAGWLAIALASAATLAHALWRLARRPRRRAPTAAAVSLLLLAWGTYAPPALAQGEPASAAAAASGAPAASAQPRPKKNPDDLSEWAIDDEFPESSIPGEGARNRNPLEFGYWLQDVADRALKASKRGDHEKAIKYFKALAKAVPDRATAFGRLCAEYEALQKRDEAIVSCAAALTRDGVRAEDYLRYVHVVLAKPDKLNEKDLGALADVIKHVKEDPNNQDLADELECEVGVKTQSARRLAPCVAALAARAPNDPKTLTYEWALAMVQDRYDDARQLVDRAKASSMKPDGIERMERETQRDQSRHRMNLFLGACSVVLALVAAAIALRTLRRRSASVVPKAEPQTS